ncbi:hypothetical protein OPV22_012483 [Ensete ventricosum]|uniref:Uncharacterized protein n=1 Tax=Ensete ventricosum TaxID=4639 RepID=A0AAV8QTE2_ENSVE|nr:hypothetical protein OPV22_012483 [Ensete ventricosum]
MDSRSIGRSGYGFEVRFLPVPRLRFVGEDCVGEKEGFLTEEQRRVMRGDPGLLCRFRKPMAKTMGGGGGAAVAVAAGRGE